MQIILRHLVFVLERQHFCVVTLANLPELSSLRWMTIQMTTLWRKLKSRDQSSLPNKLSSSLSPGPVTSYSKCCSMVMHHLSFKPYEPLCPSVCWSVLIGCSVFDNSRKGREVTLPCSWIEWQNAYIKLQWENTKHLVRLLCLHVLKPDRIEVK